MRLVNPEADQSTRSRAGFVSALQGHNWWPGLMLVAITFIVYLPVWRAGFFWDDTVFLTENPLIKKAEGLYQFWFTTAPTDYFPLTSTTLWLEWRLWGMNPLGYHLVNVGLHALSTLILWRLLVQLKIPGAWLAAALFAVHPVNVESVAWITERKNTLTMMFFLMTLFSYVRFEDVEKRYWYWLALSAFLLALLSKSAAAPLPLVLLGMAWWRRGRIGWKDVLRSVPFFVVAGLLAVVTIWFQHHRAIGADIVRTDSFWSRLAGAGWALWFYLYKAVLPLNLLSVYPRWQIDASRALVFVPGLLFLLTLAAAWHWRRRWGRGVLFGLGYFAVMLLPVLGFLNISFMRHSLVADHWQYFAIIGAIVLVAAGITTGARFLSKTQAWPSLATAAVLLITLAGLTWRQSALYTDEAKLWRHTLAGNPRSVLAYNNLGNALLEAGQIDEATQKYQSALAVEPGYADAHCNLGLIYFRQNRLVEAERHLQRALETEPKLAKAHDNLGQLMLKTGRMESAIAHLERAILLQPDAALSYGNLGAALLQNGDVTGAIAQFQKGLEIDPASPELHNNLGGLLLEQGQLEIAGNHFRAALKINPDYATARYNLGNVLFQTGKIDQAVACFEQAVKLQPDYAKAHHNLGMVLFQQGRLKDAATHLQRTLEIQSNNPAVLAALCRVAWALATCPEATVRDGAKAKDLARQLDQLSGGGSADVICILAAAQGEAGEFSEAIATAQRALRLAASTNTALIKVLESQIHSYEAGEPYRDPNLGGFKISPKTP